MKKEITPKPKKAIVLLRIVLALVAIMVLAIITGSLYAVLRPGDAEPLFRIGAGSGSASGTRRIGPAVATGGVNATSASGETAVFSGIGRLRIPLAGEPQAVLILSVSFPYVAGDRAFAEELASRIGSFRSIVTDYFGSLTASEITSLDEDAALAEILRRYNALLRLGKIETLHFGDLMVIE